MTFATGVFKKLAYKKESTWNTAAGASGAQYLRRVTSDLDLAKDIFQSNEIRTDMQTADMRHGIRKPAGTIKGELSPKTYQDFIAAALRKLFAATSDITGASITIAGTGPTFTVTRATGSFITDGVKVGDVVQLTAGSFNAANLNLNLGVLAETATVLTVMPLNGATMVAEGPIASATVHIPGKRCWTPTSGHTDDSFSIEHWFSDISQSELFTGCKVSTIAFGLPATGMATCDVGLMGGGITTAASQYYTTPTAPTTTGVLAAVNGVLRKDGVTIAYITGAQINYAGNMEAKPVVGSNTLPAIFAHRVSITGQVTGLFTDRTFADAFLNETTMGLTLWLTTNNLAAADFIGFTMPLIKLSDAKKGDGEGALEFTAPFTALFNGSGGSGTTSEQTTLVVQDSQAA